MKGIDMSTDWRLVQLFLGDTGVSEVEIAAENSKKVRCSCPQFKVYTRCKHTKFVREAMENNNGHYSIQIPVEIPDEEAVEAMGDGKLFREFILKYGKIEVL